MLKTLTGGINTKESGFGVMWTDFSIIYITPDEGLLIFNLKNKQWSYSSMRTFKLFHNLKPKRVVYIARALRRLG